MKNSICCALALTLGLLSGCAAMNGGGDVPPDQRGGGTNGANAGGFQESKMVDLSKETADSLNQKLVRGRTTRDGVIAAFGQPATKDKEGKKEVWTYRSKDDHVGAMSNVPIIGSILLMKNGGNYTVYTLTITFNAKGVVEDYSALKQEHNSDKE
jgi:outer membrane protein assembly factor BamE (lipoprotein component of BamABCDE complex)